MSSIQLTEAAVMHLKTKIDKQHGVGLYLTLEKRGCSGYAYLPKIVEDVPKACLLEMVSGVQLFLDPLWAHFFDDLTIDLEVNEQSGLKQKKLIFVHPKEKNRCGCGESFQVE